MVYDPDYFECPGCRNACSADRISCGIGEKFFAQFQKEKQARQAKQAESRARRESTSGAEAEK